LKDNRDFAKPTPKLVMREDDRVRILIFEPFWGDVAALGSTTCSCGHELWLDRNRYEEADAVVFHLPQLRKSRFPPTKRRGQLWVGYSMESDQHYPIQARRAELGPVFDVWMTYERDADIWIPYLNPTLPSDLKQAPQSKTERSPAAAFISGLHERSGRTALLGELMRHLSIDSYGSVHRNRSIWRDRGAETKRRTIAQYKFTLAFENAISRDYVTEKFFDPLIAGSVPVYLGAPNIDAFAPGDHCFVDATRFESPRALAARLTELAQDESAYREYQRWRKEPLRASFLAMIEEVRVPPFCRLAARVRQMRSDSAGPKS
jgi:hypothetical protein